MKTITRRIGTLIAVAVSAGMVAAVGACVSQDELGTSESSGLVGRTGLRGEYYDNIDFTSLKVTRVDPTINFNWGTGSPDSSIGADTFSVRWTGRVVAQRSETYRFYTGSDDGVRLWVNGEQLINNWTDHAPNENSGTIELTAGAAYDIRMEFYENGGGAVATLSWSTPTVSKRIIPTTQLLPPAETGAAPTVRDRSVAVAHDAATLSIAKPAATQPGDLLVAIVGHDSGGGYQITAPPGWTAIPNTTVASTVWDATTSGFYRFAGASEPASYNFSASSGYGWDLTAGIFAVAGADPTNPINASGGLGHTNHAAPDCPTPSLTTTVANALLLYSCTATNTTTAYDPPSGMSEAWDTVSGGAADSHPMSTEGASRVQTTAGPTGSVTAVATSGHPTSIGMLIAIAPAISSGGGGSTPPPPPACTPSCAGKACGGDGCGGSCGTCAAGQSCSTAGQCVAPTGTGLVDYGWQLSWTGPDAPGLAGAWARGEMGPYQRSTFEDSIAALPEWNNGGVRGIPDGTTLTLVKITKEIFSAVEDNVPALAVKNLTLDRVWFVGTGDPVTAQNSPGVVVLGEGTVVKDSDLDGTRYQAAGKNPEAILTYGDSTNVVVDRVRIWNFGVAAKMNGGGVMRETYVQQTTGFDGDHVDGFTRRDGTHRVDIVRSRIMTAVPCKTSGPFFIQNNAQGATNVYASDTLFEGYNYMIQWGVGTSIGMRNVRTNPFPFVDSCRVGYGDVSGGGSPILEWSDVYRYDPSKPPECKGSVVTP